MELDNIKSLKKREYLAVIINVDTRLSATLALLSALKYAGVPVLVIDCGSGDGSYGYFLRLMKEYDFDLLSAARRSHGEMLDWIFMNVDSDKVLLMDSDIEILEDTPIKLMKESISDTGVFGSGFVHEGDWMAKHKIKYGYYQERAWIPLVLFRTEPVRKALNNGQSFCAVKVYNDIHRLPFLSKLLAGRLLIPGVRNLKLKFLDRFRKEFNGVRPSLLFYDTGAAIYQYLKNKMHYRFAGISWEVNWKSIIHFHGVTRIRLNAIARNGTSLESVSSYIRDRLKKVYDFDFDKW